MACPTCTLPLTWLQLRALETHQRQVLKFLSVCVCVCVFVCVCVCLCVCVTVCQRARAPENVMPDWHNCVFWRHISARRACLYFDMCIRVMMNETDRSILQVCCSFRHIRYACMHVCIYVYVYMYIYVYIHTHRQSQDTHTTYVGKFKHEHLQMHSRELPY